MVTYSSEDILNSYKQWDEYRSALYELVINMKARSILELGASFGGSTLPILKACKEINGRLTSVDTFYSKELHDAIGILEFKEYWTFIHQDDIEFGKGKFGKGLKKKNLKEKVDLIYINTSHTYDHTIQELEIFHDHIIERGAIAMRDISCEDVSKAIKDFLSKYKEYYFILYKCCNIGIIQKR